MLIVASPTAGIVYLAFSAGSATLAAMTGTVTAQPATFLSTLFFGGAPPGISSAVLSGFAAVEDQIVSQIDKLAEGGLPPHVMSGAGFHAHAVGL